MLPDEINKLIEEFSSLPSIGPRQATRLAFYLSRIGKQKNSTFAKAIWDLEKLKPCANCFFPHDNKGLLCPICVNPQRQKDTICIVEKETDLISLEKTSKFKGVYFILGEQTKDNPQNLKLKFLKERIKKDLGGQAEEIIIAINPTSEGDLRALYLKEELKNFAKKITRLGRGLPTGGDIEFADEETLSQALENRN